MMKNMHFFGRLKVTPYCTNAESCNGGCCINYRCVCDCANSTTVESIEISERGGCIMGLFDVKPEFYI